MSDCCKFLVQHSSRVKILVNITTLCLCASFLKCKLNKKESRNVILNYAHSNSTECKLFYSFDRILEMQKALGNEAKNITNEYSSLAYFIKTKTRNVTEFGRKICKILRLHHHIIVYFFKTKYL